MQERGTETKRNGEAEQNHRSERERVTSVAKADALGRPRRSVPSLGVMDTLAKARDDFYEKRRSESLPLAVADDVTVMRGRQSGAVAAVISLESLPPNPKYLIEYADGSDEIVPLADLTRHEPDA